MLSMALSLFVLISCSALDKNNNLAFNYFGKIQYVSQDTKETINLKILHNDSGYIIHLYKPLIGSLGEINLTPKFKIYEINILGYENIDQSFIYNSFESDLLKIILKNCIEQLETVNKENFKCSNEGNKVKFDASLGNIQYTGLIFLR